MGISCFKKELLSQTEGAMKYADFELIFRNDWQLFSSEW